MSIGAEYGWGIGYMTSSGEQEDLVYNGTDVLTFTSKGNKESGIVVNNDNGGTIFGGTASFNVTFHF